MLLADIGTSYAKLMDTETGTYRLVAVRDLPADGRRADWATGHNGKRFGGRYVNELTALARGGAALIEEPSFTLLDCGSRDIKFVRYDNGAVKDMGWNDECGASMGFTIELLQRYYQLDFGAMSVPPRSLPITCGVLGISAIFDAVVNGQSESEAVARFIKGIALNGYQFAGSPDTLYLSGGLCENPLFTGSFPCTVVCLGRWVLLEGLKVSIGMVTRDLL
jgi:hypothetical protein